MVGLKSDVGIRRKLNEDYADCIENDEYKLYIVADGMGGHNDGEVASKMAVDEIREYIKNNFSHGNEVKVLEDAVKYTNTKVNEYSISRNNLKGMGTTLVVALVSKESINIANIGDSGCFGITKNKIVKITKDHSLVQELIDSGSITEEEGRNHPQKNVITRALGTESNVKVDIFSLKKGIYDKFLLCTDGLTNELTNEEILKIVNKSENYIDVCDELILLAKKNGGRDNITVVLFGGEV